MIVRREVVAPVLVLEQRKLNRGQIADLSINSRILQGNRAGDPTVRPVRAYIPSAAAHTPTAKFPVLYLLAAWTNAGRSQFDWKPFKESLSERLDRLIHSGAMRPAVVVAVDTYSRFGGSQYIDSDFFGPHARHIVEELIPFCEQNLPILSGPKHRGVFGRSSGGFGALRLAMDFPGIFSAAASHSGDMGFELLFGGDLVNFPDKLSRYQGKVRNFLDFAWQAPKLSGGDVHLLMLLGMCGFYSPNLSSDDGFDLPIDLQNGSIRHDIWSKWLENDPVRRSKLKRDGLALLKYLYLDCGTRDQYHLLYGARQLHGNLSALGVRHDFEEFNDDHSGTDYRFDVSLPAMTNALLA
jgi:enterochelin esterase-like enzyme